jgi:quercetin dioxygenase-like cupin family protein
VLRLEPNQYHPLHNHPDLGELYFVLNGVCEVQLGDDVHSVEAGTAIYIPKGVGHSLRTESNSVEVLIVFPEGDLSKVRKEWM